LPFDGDEFEVLQPLDPALRDYAARVRDAVEVLAIAESRSELEILQLLSSASMDVHTVRIMPNDQPPGMIGIDDGVAAVESLRNLVSAAAYTVFAATPRVVQPARKPQGVGDFLREVRIGPAAEGSYTLSVHTPVPPLLAHDQASILHELGLTGPEPEPVGRQVSVRMYEAVKAAHTAAESALLTADGLDYFTDAVGQGVSANLCEALSGLGGAGRHPFDVSLAVAASRPTNATFPAVRFRRDHLPVLQQAAEDLRARTPEDDVLVTGNVVRLYRDRDATASGEITVVGRVDEQEALRRIWMELPADAYEVAMRAHERMRQVSVRGSLLRRGTRLFLGRPTGFAIVD
jgi:hypothetical protein